LTETKRILTQLREENHRKDVDFKKKESEVTNVARDKDLMRLVREHLGNNF
jgi:hypothetical protein